MKKTGMDRGSEQSKLESNPGIRKGKKKKKKKSQKGFLLSDVCCTTPEPHTSVEKKVVEEDKTASGQEAEYSDLEKFSNDNTLLSEETKEKQNLCQVLGLINGIGLPALRRLFMEIHPTWSNKPGDAMNLDKGVMELKEHELALFDKGDINKWDVSLLTTVLLYSKKCKNEIAKRPGFEAAIRGIKKHKNKLISHQSLEKIPDTDYIVYWDKISGHLKTIGVSTEAIEDLQHKGNILEKGKFYQDMFLKEVASSSGIQSALFEKIQQVESKVDQLAKPPSGESETKKQLIEQYSGPDWDEWIKFYKNVHHFDHCQNNYILISDTMSPESLECFSTLRSLPWKMVLDFDFASEKKGMYHDFVSKDAGKGSLPHMITPAEVRRQPIANLAGYIDANKTQWMFVNGRESDGSPSNGGPQEFEDWEDVSLKEISTFFRCYSEPDKLDKNKPVICLILPFREEKVPFINVTLKRLMENFNEFELNFVGIKQDQCSTLLEKLPKKINIRTTDLSPALLRLGIENHFHVSSEQSYSMPTSQAKVPAKLTHKEFLYLKEYLELLYEGCEEPPNMDDDKQGKDKMDELIEEHKNSFMSGNWISLLSLRYNHDAKREIGNEIQIHIQRLLDKGPAHTTTVEISHSPGSGGSTIARRVMWDLHKSYPCAFAKLEDHNFDLEDDRTFLDNLADRISDLQEKCYTTPVVLLDGKHARIEALSNRLTRILNTKGKKALFLRCNHQSSSSGESKNQNISESSDVHHTFFVNVKLDESKADLKEFEEKYKDYITRFRKRKSSSDLSRVFHFPLLAMVEKFNHTLQQIIFESFDEMEPLEREILLVVAFLQKYAANATPAPLLDAAFNKSGDQSGHCRNGKHVITYEGISNKYMTERLWNLMVPANPANYIHRGRFKRTNCFQVRYTLQHPKVAELVLEKAKMALKLDTFAITRDFLGFSVYDDVRFIPLLKDLFVLNGCRQGKFSELFEELKALDPSEAGKVFFDAADKTKDVVVTTSAARFYAKVPPQCFSKAKELIAKSFECRNAKEKKKTIYDVNGVVLSKEMQFLSRNDKINSLDDLEHLADEALKSFRSARTFPPTFPNPLIGEVKTWLACIDWITKNQCDGDSNKALQFITSHDAPPFFCNCVNESFILLNIVDEIVQTVSNLSNPETTQREANNLRLSLMKTLNSNERHLADGRNETDVIQACKSLCSAAEFPTSSELELKRLQVQYVFSSVKQIENVNRKELEYVLELLKELVEVEKDAHFAKHLMKICVLFTGRTEYSLDQGLAVCSIWSRNHNYDPLPYFYEMMIYFVNILDGNAFEYRSKYHDALDNCRSRSQHNCRKTMSTHYLGKPKGRRMSRLMTKNTLFRGETEYRSFSNNEEAETYWKTNSRKKLLECSGRIRTRTSSSGKKDLCIELLQGNVQLHVAKNAGIGKPDRDFVPGSIVYFVVSFNLLGPVANGITFNPSFPQVS